MTSGPSLYVAPAAPCASAPPARRAAAAAPRSISRSMIASREFCRLGGDSGAQRRSPGANAARTQVHGQNGCTLPAGRGTCACRAENTWRARALHKEKPTAQRTERTVVAEGMPVGAGGSGEGLRPAGGTYDERLEGARDERAGGRGRGWSELVARGRK